MMKLALASCLGIAYLTPSMAQPSNQMANSAPTYSFPTLNLNTASNTASNTATLQPRRTFRNNFFPANDLSRINTPTYPSNLLVSERPPSTPRTWNTARGWKFNQYQNRRYPNVRYPTTRYPTRPTSGDTTRPASWTRPPTPSVQAKQDCLGGDIMYSHGDSLGYIGTTCTSQVAFIGDESVCNNGQIQERPYEGVCPQGMVCCQSGKVGTIGGATCVTEDICDEFQPRAVDPCDTNPCAGNEECERWGTNCPTCYTCTPIEPGSCDTDQDCGPDGWCAWSMWGTTSCVEYRGEEKSCNPALQSECRPDLLCDESQADEENSFSKGDGICRRTCLGPNGSCEYPSGPDGDPRPQMVMGRPFTLSSGEAVLASVRNSSHRSSWCLEDPDADSSVAAHVATVDDHLPSDDMVAQSRRVAQSQEVHARWVHDGLAEHASVASFSRFSLELLSLGAPAELVAATHSAALDEIKHAKICLGLANAFSDVLQSGVSEPGPFVVPGGRVELSGNIGEVVRHTIQEGCVGETVSTAQAFFEKSTLNHSLNSLGMSLKAVNSALETIFKDEARHSALAWNSVEWTLGTRSPDAKRALQVTKEQIALLKKEVEVNLRQLGQVSAEASHRQDHSWLPLFMGAALPDRTKKLIHTVTLAILVIPALEALVGQQSSQEHAFEVKKFLAGNTSDHVQRWVSNAWEATQKAMADHLGTVHVAAK